MKLQLGLIEQEEFIIVQGGMRSNVSAIKCGNRRDGVVVRASAS